MLLQEICEEKCQQINVSHFSAQEASAVIAETDST